VLQKNQYNQSQQIKLDGGIPQLLAKRPPVIIPNPSRNMNIIDTDLQEPSRQPSRLRDPHGEPVTGFTTAFVHKEKPPSSFFQKHTLE